MRRQSINVLTCRFTPGSCCCLGLGFLDCIEPLGRAPSCCICCCWCRKLPRSIFGNFDTWLPARAPSRLERRDPFLRPLTAAWPILHDECGPPMPPDLSRCKGRDLIMSLHAATRDVAADDSAHALLCPDVAADDAAEAGSHGRLDKLFGPLLFPSGSVNHPRHPDAHSRHNVFGNSHGFSLSRSDLS